MKNVIRKGWEWGLFAVLAIVIVSFSASAALSQEPSAKSGTLEWTVSVPTGGIGAAVEMELVGRARYIRATTTSSTIRMYALTYQRNAAGGLTGTEIRKPYGEGALYPNSSAIYWQLLPSTLEVWNTYVDVFADELVIYNTGTTADCTIQIILE